MYDMLGNAWEWVSDEFKDKGRETKYVLRGGSYIDTADGKHNHKVTVTTRYAKPFWKIMILVIHTGYMQCFSVLYTKEYLMSHLYTSQYTYMILSMSVYVMLEKILSVATTISATHALHMMGRLGNTYSMGFPES